MTDPITIIGSGFAAYQLIKTIRRTDTQIAIRVITSNSGDDYNKPDISHVFSKQQSPDSLVRQTGKEFAQQHNIELIPNTLVENIDPKSYALSANGQILSYSKLVIATGASTFIPNIEGEASDAIITLNSLDEYRQNYLNIGTAQRVLLMGGGLIGTELAMDLLKNGKQVTLIEPNDQLLPNLLPDFVANSLGRTLKRSGLNLALNDSVESINKMSEGLIANTTSGKQHQVDCVISTAGLRANIHLAQLAGLETNRGIVVNDKLQTSEKDIYAIGDCAEIHGQVMAYLQPIILSANTLAQQLLDKKEAELKLPAMMIKVKTPDFPIQIGGTSDAKSRWEVSFQNRGIRAKAYNEHNEMTGFVVSQEFTSQAFPMMRELVSS